MSDLNTLTAVGNKVDTKIQNCVWDVRRFILLTNLVIDLLLMKSIRNFWQKY